MEIVHVVSISTGKDSQATMQLALKRVGKPRCRFVMCDTGNEDPRVFEHADYLRRTLDIDIEVLRADFSKEIAARREFIARDVRVGREYDTIKLPDGREKKVGGGRRIRWSNKAKRRALAVLHPTGNPYLDLCLWKGRFPSRKGQFCTEELKTIPMVEYQMRLMDQGIGVVSWQGVRRDESANRKNAKIIERVGKRLWIYRPVATWTAQQVVDHCLSEGVMVNPLYSEGFDRVGCMPCINCGKKDIANTARRRPEAIDRLEEWEWLVGQASKRGQSSFFPNPDREKHLDKRGVRKMVQWAKTSRGGSQYMLLEEPAAGCSSSYGLCDAPQ